MTIKLYIGSSSEITARLAGSPNTTVATITSVASLTQFDLDYTTSFSAGDSIVVDRYKAVIDTIVSNTVTLKNALPVLPVGGNTVRHYDADYTKYRDSQASPLTIVSDLKSGGGTGDNTGQELTIFDYDDQMPIPEAGARVTIFESTDSATPLFAGVIQAVTSVVGAKHLSNNLAKYYSLTCVGHRWEADAVGIEEQPLVNINSGKFIDYLRQKYTLLSVGEIDTTTSPNIDYVRIANYKRFSDVAAEVVSIWPGAEFFIQNDHAGGSVYFRKRVTRQTPFTLNNAFLEVLGGENVSIKQDHSKVYNIVRYPFYYEVPREPDYFYQEAVVDSAFLKSSVILQGQPPKVEESLLLFDDFGNGEVSTDFTEDDITNPSPPSGFNSADGYLLQGTLNQVKGLHFVDTTAISPAAKIGDLGIVTDPGETEPFTGAERQQMYIQEMVISTLGEAVIMGITDLTALTCTTITGSTASKIYVDNVSGFFADDRIDVNGQKTYITAVGGNYFDVSPNVTAPSAGVTVTLHRLALSRIKFGLHLTAAGDLKYIKNGVSTGFSTPRTYTASPTTYSFRIYMRAFETTVTGTPSAGSCDLADATNFTTGDVVELYTKGSKSNPVQRVITKSGANITFSDTDDVIKVGYRVRTLPKIVVEVKGGTYGTITERTWTQIHVEANTYQTVAATPVDARAVLVIANKSLIGTIPLFQLKDPIGVTAECNGRYLNIGTQEVDSSEPDIDCIIRKIGTHYQLDFFPDTKDLWSSGTALELRYNDKFRYDMVEYNTTKMSELATARGQTLSANPSEDELIKLGGRSLDTIQILPNSQSLDDAGQQARAILSAVESSQASVVIKTNTYAYPVVRAGDMIPSELPGVPDLEVQSVRLTEIPGASYLGASVFIMEITAGTIDRLEEVLLKRQIKNSSRVVIDDGYNDDTFTRIQKTNFADTTLAQDAFTVDECTNPSIVIYDGSLPSEMRCLLIA